MSEEREITRLKGLKKARLEKDWTQGELASAAGLCGRGEIWKLERAECSINPSISTVKRLAQALGIPIDLLVYGHEL